MTKQAPDTRADGLDQVINTIFLGGSRRVSRLPELCRNRLDTIIAGGHRIVVGDASGVDKAVQKHILGRGYEAVTVFCTGPSARNNVGGWSIEHVVPPKAARGFAFYAAKDREMARAADFGLMIWDGESPGTLLNVLRLVRAGKIAVLHNARTDTVTNFKGSADWDAFIKDCDPEIVREVGARATPEEWSGVPQERDEA